MHHKKMHLYGIVVLASLELTQVCYAPPELPLTGPIYPEGIRVVAAMRVVKADIPGARRAAFVSSSVIV